MVPTPFSVCGTSHAIARMPYEDALNQNPALRPWEAKDPQLRGQSHWRPHCVKRKKSMIVRSFLHIIILSVCCLWSHGALATGSCPDIPHIGPESLDFEVTIRDTGQPLNSGDTVPSGIYVRWHFRATAYGHCEVISPPVCTYYFTDYRKVARIQVDAVVDTTSGQMSGRYFDIMGHDANGATAWYHELDTHNLSTTYGPQDDYMYGRGSYEFNVKNLIMPTICNIQPTSVEKPFVLYVHDFTNDEDLACGKKGTTAGNPCHVRTGNKYQREVDSSGDVLPIVRHYNSHLTSIDFGLGRGWLTPYLRQLEVYLTSTGARAHYRRGDGYGERFNRTGTTWAAETDSSSKLVEDSTGYTVTYLTRSSDRFDLNGRLLESTDEAGATIELSYDTSGKLMSVVDDYGHQLIFTYNAGGRVASIDRGGNIYSYTYDSVKGNLTRVTHPDGTTRDYLYEKTSHPHHLTGIVDEGGVRWGTYTYDSSGRATASQHPGGAEDVSLAYTGFYTTSVTDALGVPEPSLIRS